MTRNSLRRRGLTSYGLATLLVFSLLGGSFAVPSKVSAAPVPPAVTVATTTTISLGMNHSCAIEAEDLFAPGGTLRCWGSDASGQIGNGGGDSRSPVDQGGVFDWVTVSAGGRHTCAIRSSDQLACWGRNTSGQLGRNNVSTSEAVDFSYLTDDAWMAVAAGGEHTCAIQIDRTLWCWAKRERTIRNRYYEPKEGAYPSWGGDELGRRSGGC